MTKILNFLKSSRLSIIILIFGFVLIYWKVLFIFFVQDELLVLGLIKDQGKDYLFRGFDGSSIHITPLLNLVSIFLFNAFKLNHFVYGTLGFLIHLVNSLLIYFLIQENTKKKVLAWLGTLLFFSSSAASQLVMWPLVSLSTLSLTFILFAWIYIARNENFELKFKDILVICLLIVSAILLLDYATGFFIFFIILLLMQKNPRKIRDRLNSILPLIVLAFSYIVVRIFLFLSYINEKIPGVREGIDSTYLINTLSFPIRYIGQLFLPESVILSIARNTQRFFADAFDIQSLPEFEPFRIIAFLIGLAVALFYIEFIFLVSKRIGNQLRFLILATIFLFSSVLPFMFLPGTFASFFIIPSRYLYFGLVFYCLFTVAVVNFVGLSKSKLMKFSLGLILLAFVILGVKENFEKSNQLYAEGSIRENILKKIKNDFPDLPDRTVFYTESDKSYYGLPEHDRIMPFQSGFGQTLLVWYQQSENWPAGFYSNKFLWEIQSQGYKQLGDRGFGYFRNFDILAGEVEKNNIPLESVISFRYDSEIEELVNNSEELRGRLKGNFAPKRKLTNNNFIVSTITNSSETSLAQDGDRETYWSSIIPYKDPILLELDLKLSFEVLGVEIDSYVNKDQNNVGYKVSLSEDGEKWKSVFYSKRYSPDKNGITSIYFEPQKARFIRVYQKGFHEFAPWVVHELEVYVPQ